MGKINLAPQPHVKILAPERPVDGLVLAFGSGGVAPDTLSVTLRYPSVYTNSSDRVVV